MDINVLIGGAAGQGMETISSILERILHRKGYFVFSNKDYMSRIRGGHNFNLVRISSKKLYSHKDSVNVILALNKETIEIHRDRLVTGGKIICDSKLGINHEDIISIPLEDIAGEMGDRRASGTVALGALLKIFTLDKGYLHEVLKMYFSGDILEINIKAAEKGYELSQSFIKLKAPETIEKLPRILINGNESIALGALAAGCSFYSAYPMTPSTSIMNYLAAKQRDAGILVEQAEDEIAAINMALGAAYAGVRSMTGTSGGGFSLMVEGLSLAGMIETPVVIVDSQRPGPATGFPTRTEQGDLSFILTAGHGEFPRVVIAVKNPEDAFYQTARAFNLADKYQIPVIILTDQYLADYTQSTEVYDFSKIKIERHLSTQEDLPDGEYMRYKISESGISPRIIPGKIPGQVVLVDSDEHNERGNITESAQVRIAMANKRMNKICLIEEETIEPELMGSSGRVVLVAWGSMYGPIKEAVELLNQEGYDLEALVFGDLWPLPKKRLYKLAAENKVFINIEQNYTGQLAKLIRQETSITCDKSLLKHDGRMLGCNEIYRWLKREVMHNV
ncbi:2-oxoacid:acceptor oxidoreductase subunit alpha [Desulfitibacter alkalitolerans]|uniref:2-oxoacid:acceptor oxidoreductase subunit alpha n=1 Tax=Desulfitibacter alkalitolerans TaxID=264641 RepID=UPI00047F1FE5|nr:2-oxoacid:acceptor oxidoreductase subunit alpha [Desulfitibacter alkalitolerans]